MPHKEMAALGKGNIFFGLEQEVNFINQGIKE